MNQDKVMKMVDLITSRRMMSFDGIPVVDKVAAES